MHEYRFAHMQIACREVAEIQDQPPPVEFYRPGDSRPYHHWFDFLIRLKSGRRLAFAVKPTEELEETTLVADIELICEQSLEGFADAAFVITDEFATFERGDNAAEVVHAMKCRNSRDCEEVWSYLRSIEGPVSFLEVCDRFDVHGRARNAVLCLIYDGLVEHLNPDERFDDAPLITVNSLSNHEDITC